MQKQVRISIRHTAVFCRTLRPCRNLPSGSRVKEQLAKERTEAAQAEFAEEDRENWQTLLELDKQGKVKDTLTNIALILRYESKLKNIVFNEFKSMVDVIGPLPSRR